MTLPGLEHHPHARAVLEPALRRPSHAYLFLGPPGAGKARVARAFAAALLAPGDPEAAGRVDRGTHPDLVWVRPSGAAEMLVSDIDEPVVLAATRTPFESERRVFVLEDAEAMNDAAANRMLKTLEEPAPFAHLLLLSSRPEELLETIRSRCQPVRFQALPASELAAELEQAEGASPEQALACARLSLGNGRLARELLGHGLREAAEALARGQGPAPWKPLLELAAARGKRATETLAQAHAERLEFTAKGDRRRLEREHGEQARRAARRASQLTLDQGLALAGLWFRDAACIADGASELVYATDRMSELEQAAAAAPAPELRQRLEQVEHVRRALQRNVNEELALEALSHRLAPAA